MADRAWQVGKVQIVFRRSSRLLKILLTALIVLSTAALSALWIAQTNLLRQTEELRSEGSQLQYENSELDRKIENADSLSGMLEIARDELGMVTSDSILIQTQE